MERPAPTRSPPGNQVVVDGPPAGDDDHVTVHASDDGLSNGLRYERIALRVPPDVAHPEDVDLGLIASIIASGELTAEIDAANNHVPDLAV